MGNIVVNKQPIESHVLRQMKKCQLSDATIKLLQNEGFTSLKIMKMNNIDDITQHLKNKYKIPIAQIGAIKHFWELLISEGEGMWEDEKQALQRCQGKLRQNMSPTVLDKLLEMKVLSDTEIQDCRSYKSRSECVDKLLKYLAQKQDKCFEEFGQALSNTGQKNLAKFLFLSLLPDTESQPCGVRNMMCIHEKHAREIFATLKLSDEFFDKTHDICYCEECHAGRRDCWYYISGHPPKEYASPVGWFKFGLGIPPRAMVSGIFEKWIVAFHGTSKDKLDKILTTGDLLMAGDTTSDGTELTIPESHIQSEESSGGYDVRRTYLSPTIRYAGLPVYAPAWEYTRGGETLAVSFAFQVRLQPESYEVGPKTVRLNCIDPSIPDSELEWSTKRRGVVVLTGLLVQVQRKEKGPSAPDIDPVRRLPVYEFDPHAMRQELLHDTTN